MLRVFMRVPGVDRIDFSGVHNRRTGVRMFFWTVRRPVQDFCGIARGSSSPVTS